MLKVFFSGWQRELSKSYESHIKQLQQDISESKTEVTRVESSMVDALAAKNSEIEALVSSMDALKKQAALSEGNLASLQVRCTFSFSLSILSSHIFVSMEHIGQIAWTLIVTLLCFTRRTWSLSWEIGSLRKREWCRSVWLFHTHDTPVLYSLLILFLSSGSTWGAGFCRTESRRRARGT